jgi:hypothetical protein
MQHLDHDVALEGDVFGEKDARHASPPEFADDAIRRAESGLELRGEVGVQDGLGTAERRRSATARR